MKSFALLLCVAAAASAHRWSCRKEPPCQVTLTTNGTTSVLYSSTCSQEGADCTYDASWNDLKALNGSKISLRYCELKEQDSWGYGWRRWRYGRREKKEPPYLNAACRIEVKNSTHQVATDTNRCPGNTQCLTTAYEQCHRPWSTDVSNSGGWGWGWRWYRRISTVYKIHFCDLKAPSPDPIFSTACYVKYGGKQLVNRTTTCPSGYTCNYGPVKVRASQSPRLEFEAFFCERDRSWYGRWGRWLQRWRSYKLTKTDLCLIPGSAGNVTTTTTTTTAPVSTTTTTAGVTQATTTTTTQQPTTTTTTLSRAVEP